MGQSYEPVPGLEAVVESARSAGFRLIPYILTGSQAATSTTSQENNSFIINSNNPFIMTGIWAYQSAETWTFRIKDQAQGLAFASAQTIVTNQFAQGFVPFDHPYTLGPGSAVGLDYTMTTGSSATLYVSIKGILCLLSPGFEFQLPGQGGIQPL